MQKTNEMIHYLKSLRNLRDASYEKMCEFGSIAYQYEKDHGKDYEYDYWNNRYQEEKQNVLRLDNTIKKIERG